MTNQTGRMALLLIALPLVLLVVAGCETKQSEATEGAARVLAEVNGTPITAADLEFSLAGTHGQKITPDLREKVLGKLIERELIYQKGIELGMDKDEKYQAAVRKMALRFKAFERNEMYRRVYNREIAARISVKEEEARRFYEENRDEIESEYHLAVISFRNERQANEALARIQGGKPFAEVAEERKPIRQKTAPQTDGKPPWDLGFLRWNQIPAEFMAVVRLLAPGEVTGVVKSERVGIRILQLLEKKKSDRANFARMKASIMNRLKDRKIAERYKEYIQRLKQDGEIVEAPRP